MPVPGIRNAMSATGFDALMTHACVGWGFCGCVKHDQPRHVTMLIPPDGPGTADQFVEWLLLADNLNPNLGAWHAHKTALRAAFVRHMGADVVDAQALRWSHLLHDDEPDGKLRGPIPDGD